MSPQSRAILGVLLNRCWHCPGTNCPWQLPERLASHEGAALGTGQHVAGPVPGQAALPLPLPGAAIYSTLGGVQQPGCASQAAAPGPACGGGAGGLAAGLGQRRSCGLAVLRGGSAGAGAGSSCGGPRR